MKTVFEVKTNYKITTNVDPEIMEKINRIKYGEFDDNGEEIEEYNPFQRKLIWINFYNGSLEVCFEFNEKDKEFYAISAKDLVYGENHSPLYIGQKLEINSVLDEGEEEPLPF